MNVSQLFNNLSLLLCSKRSGLGGTAQEGLLNSRLNAGWVTVLSLGKTLYLLLNTDVTQEDRKLSLHDRKTVDWDVKHQNKQRNYNYV